MRDRGIDALDVANDLKPLFERDDRLLVFVGDELVGRNPDDELVAKTLRVLEKVQVSDVKEVVDPAGVADGHCRSLSWLLRKRSRHQSCHFWLPENFVMSRRGRNSGRTGPVQSAKYASTGRGIGFLFGTGMSG